MKFRMFILACLLATALQNEARAHTPSGEATGIPDMTFGMSPDEVKKTYPDLVLTMAPPEPQEGQPNIRLSIYRLVGQKFGKLTCNIDLKFLVDRLSYLDFFCSEKEDVPAYLEATYGKPSTQGETGWQWQGKQTTVSYAPAVGTFNVLLNRANDSLQGNMFLYQMMQQGQAPAPGQPGAAQPAVQ